MHLNRGDGNNINIRLLKYVICVLVSLSVIPDIQSQNSPVFGQFYTNPYLINPAYVGIEGRPAMFLTYRQQWMGVKGAPKSANFNFHTPLTNGLSLGVNFYDDSRSLLRNDVGALTLGYAIGITEKEYIRFGMSAGAGFRMFDLSSADTPDDPVLGNINENSIYLAGNFGLSFHSGYFSLGFALPQIFDSDITPSASFPTENQSLSPLDRYIINASYRFYFGLDEMAFEPHLVYYANKDIPSQWEAVGLFHIKYNLWAGASYRSDFGIAGLVGIKLGGSFSLGYSYTVPSEKTSIGVDTHEIQLGLLLRKNDKRKSQILSFVDNERIYWNLSDDNVDDFFAQDPVIVEEPEPEPEPEPESVDVVEYTIPIDTTGDGRNPRLDVIDDIANSSDSLDNAEISERTLIERSGERYEIVQTGDHLLEMRPGNYIIVGAFGVFENAERYSDQLYEVGQRVRFGFLTGRGLWHVYIYQSETLIGIRDELAKVRNIPQFREAWLLTVE